MLVYLYLKFRVTPGKTNSFNIIVGVIEPIQKSGKSAICGAYLEQNFGKFDGSPFSVSDSFRLVQCGALSDGLLFGLFDNNPGHRDR